MATECIDKSSAKRHGIKVPHDRYTRTFRYGDHQLEPFTMQANTSIEIITEWNWTDSAKPKDWSVVVWAKDGPITIVNQNGNASDVMPVI